MTKKIGLSIIAAAMLASTGVAGDITVDKKSASLKLYYETINSKDDTLNDNGDYDGFFKKGSSQAQALVSVGFEGGLDAEKQWGYGIEYMVADTLGLEGQAVSGTRMGMDSRTTTVSTETQDWASQAYVTFAPAESTSLKIGRQYLNTPLAFTETWNLAPNSFDATVITNKSLPNTTLVGAYVGQGNGAFATVTNGSQFAAYGVGRGAYAIGANIKVEPADVNLWYYTINSNTGANDGGTAYWADANVKAGPVGIGLQYGSVQPDADNTDATTGYGIKAGAPVGPVDLEVAYSSVGEDGVATLGNTATQNGSGVGKKSSLYTEAIYTDGTAVAIAGSTATKVKAAAKLPFGKLIAQYVSCTNDNKAAMQNVNEIDVILATKLAGIDSKFIYMNRSVSEGENETDGVASNAATWLNNNTDHIRIIFSKSF